MCQGLAENKDKFPKYVFQHLKTVPATSSLHGLVKIPELLVRKL